MVIVKSIVQAEYGGVTCPSRAPSSHPRIPFIFDEFKLYVACILEAVYGQYELHSFHFYTNEKYAINCRSIGSPERRYILCSSLRKDKKV